MADHVIDRALERYGIAITRHDLRLLEARLGGGEGMVLRRNPDGGEMRVIRFEGQLVTLVFQPWDGRIKTFLPADKPFASAQRRYGHSVALRQGTARRIR